MRRYFVRPCENCNNAFRFNCCERGRAARLCPACRKTVLNPLDVEALLAGLRRGR